MSLIASYYLAIIIFYISHSWLVSFHVKLKVLTYLSSKNYRLFYNILSIGLLLLIFKLYNSIVHEQLFSFPEHKSIGFILMILGFIFSYISFKSYNTLEFLGLATENENEKLSVKGMNKYVRHPLYSSGLIILWGALLVVPTSAYLGFALITTLYIYWGTKLEEKKLITKFGAAYTTYKEEVPMLIPKITK